MGVHGPSGTVLFVLLVFSLACTVALASWTCMFTVSQNVPQTQFLSILVLKNLAWTPIVCKIIASFWLFTVAFGRNFTQLWGPGTVHEFWDWSPQTLMHGPGRYLSLSPAFVLGQKASILHQRASVTSSEQVPHTKQALSRRCLLSSFVDIAL